MEHGTFNLEYHQPLFSYIARKEKYLTPNGRLRIARKIVQSVTKKHFGKSPIENSDALYIVEEID